MHLSLVSTHTSGKRFNLSDVGSVWRLFILYLYSTLMVAGCGYLGIEQMDNSDTDAPAAATDAETVVSDSGVDSPDTTTVNFDSSSAEDTLDTSIGTETESETTLPHTDSETNTASEMNTDTNTDTVAETTADTQSAIDSNAETDTPTDSESITDSSTGTGTDSDTDSDTDSGTGTGTDTDTETETETETETDTGTDSVTDSDTDSGTGTDTDTIPACVRRVDLNAHAAMPDGLTWATAFDDIQSAIDAAALETPPCEIWVANGTYLLFGGTNDSIVLSSGIELYGGFGGLDVGETARNQRDTSLSVNPVVVSGNNISYHIFAGAENGVIDGFIISLGQASGTGFPDNYGGGIFHTSGTLTVRNVNFVSNKANGGGGAIYVGNASLLLSDSTFLGNVAGDLLNLGAGGAIFAEDAEIHMDNSSFSLNGSIDNTLYGGAIYLTNSDSSLVNSKISKSHSLNEGALFISGGSHTLSQVLFTNNRSTIRGAALSAFSGATVNGSNIVLSSNTGTGEGKIYMGDAALSLVNSTLYSAMGDIYADNTAIGAQFRNTILWADGDNAIVSDNIAPTVSYSIISGGWAGTAVSSANPSFVFVPDNLALNGDSPAIDAANGDIAPATDYLDSTRYDATNADTGVGTPSYADIGAYEYWP